jgi:hypothetical protein
VTLSLAFSCPFYFQFIDFGPDLTQMYANLHASVREIKLVNMRRGRRLRALLPPPTPPRQTPIATTALPFMICLDAEGVMEVRVID